MNLCECPKINPLQRDGTSQVQRFLFMLDPEYVLSDERTLEDILVFAKDYASLIRYYDINENNINEENWTELIKNDITVLVSIISKTSVDEIKSKYNDKYKTLIKVTNKPNFKDYTDFIKDLAELINDWYAASCEEHSLRKDLKIIIDSSLAASYSNLIDLINNAESIWDPNNSNNKKNILDISSKINTIFENIINIIIKLVKCCPDYLKAALHYNICHFLLWALR